MFSPPGRSRKLSPARAMLEALEDRRLCSVTGAFVAQPNVTFAPDLTGGSAGYSPAQIRHAYGFDQVRFGSVAGDGSGQTIAIVDAYNDPNITADLHTFDQHFGIADPSFRKVNEFGGASLPSNDAGWSLEIALDVEWAHAIAPKANLLLVEASSENLGDLLAAVNTARNAAGVSAVSMSWGGGEFWGQTYYDSTFTTPAGHQGVTFVAASGDSGSWYGPEWPASSRNVLSVGGTTLNVSNTVGSYQSETGWGGSGGGISSLEPEPSWQYRAQGTGARTTPDVSFDANPSSGFAVYDSVPDGGYSGWQVVGGTSAGAPQWAALVAIANQGRALNHLGTLNGATQTLPALYSMTANAFHDVTRGQSSWFFGAAPGYDAVTGLGSPQAQYLITVLAGTTGSSSTQVGSSAKPKTTTTTARIVRAAEAPSVAAAFVQPAGASIEPVRNAAVAVSVDPIPTRSVRTTGAAAAAASARVPVALRATAFSSVPIAWAAGASALVPVAIVRPAGAASFSQIAADGPPSISAVEHESAAVTYNLLRVDPADLFNDSTEGLIRETASLSATGAAAVQEHSWAWLATAAVLTVHGILITRWHLARRKRAAAAANGSVASPFSVTPLTRDELN